jgi:hypothetical protein
VTANKDVKKEPTLRLTWRGQIAVKLIPRATNSLPVQFVTPIGFGKFSVFDPVSGEHVAFINARPPRALGRYPLFLTFVFAWYVCYDFECHIARKKPSSRKVFFGAFL